MVCSKLWYSTNGGSTWSAAISINASSGTYTITGLSPATNYSVKTSVRAKDSGLDGYSTASSWNTYNYPYANSTPNFTIGNDVTIGLYNPLGRTVSVTITAGGTDKTAANTVSGKSITGFSGSTWKDFFYAAIPSAKSGTYSVKVTYSAHTETRTGGTFSANSADCKPTAGTLTYQDTNNTTTAITGNNQKIVQNASTVRYTATGYSTKYSATISSIKVKVNGQTYTLTQSGASATGGNAVINSGTNVTATLTVTDSRGYTASSTKTIQMLSYSQPSADITLQRQNNYYSDTDITVDASWSYLNGGNSCAIKFRYKQTSSSTWGSYINLTDNTAYTFTANNKYTFDVQVVLTDTIGGSTTYNLVLAKGTTIMFWDTLRTAVGVNCFPQSDESLWVNGYEVDAKNLLKWGSLDQYVSLEPDDTHVTGLTHSQGMACDGTNLYITNRSSYNDTEAMKITKIQISDWSTVSTHTMTTGHYNSLYWYNNKLYATGASMDSGSVDYSNVRVINSNWTTSLVSTPSCYGCAIIDFSSSDKGVITALQRAGTRDIIFYDSYNQDQAQKQTPLMKITLDYTGSTTLQGSFHLTPNYIWTIETAYNADTRASGHQVARCFSYSGMLVRAFYLDSITKELQDIWVSDDDSVMYINDLDGTIYKFNLTHLYHSLVTSVANGNTLRQGTPKHVYINPSNLDSTKTYTRNNSSYKVTSVFPLSDFTFINEISEFVPPTLWVNGQPCVGDVAENMGSMWFAGAYGWAGGGTLSFEVRFTRTSDSYNYKYYLSKVTFRIHDSSTHTTYTATSTDGDLTDESTGSMGAAFKALYSDGWLFGDFYVDSLTYIVGLPRSSTDLGIL